MAECCAAAGSGFVRPIAGGVACFAEPGSPYNKVAGLGFGGVPSIADLDEVEKAYSDRGASVQIELPHLADPEIGVLLTNRGYRLESFENVLGLALTGDYEPAAPPGIMVRPSGDDEFDRWLDVLSDAVAHPDTQGCPGTRSSLATSTNAPNASPPRPVSGATLHYATASSPAAPVSAPRRASHSSPALPPLPLIAAAASRPRCWPPGSPTRRPRAATSPSSPPNQAPSRSRTLSVEGSTCSTPGASS